MNSLTKIIVVGLIGFYFGGGFTENPVRYENPDKIIEHRVVEVEKPILPEPCKEALQVSNKTLLRIDESVSEYDALLSSCFDSMDMAYERGNRDFIVANSFNRYMDDQGPVYSEEQIQEAFDHCEIDYEDADYCDEVLDEYLEDMEPESN